MNLKIGEKIKSLRKSQDITQEKLAEYLKISYQAVSKWENGTALPDITLVPSIANFFNVSADELFNLGEQIKNEKVKEYENEYLRFNILGDTMGRIELSRKVLTEYPRNYQFMVNLAYALTQYDATEEQGKFSREHHFIEEAISICERVLEDCTIDGIRHSAIQILCYEYPKIGKREQAIELARNMPDIYCSSSMLLAHTYEGEERIKQNQGNLLCFIDLALGALQCGTCDNNEVSIEQKIEYYKCGNALLELIFRDKDYNFYNDRLATSYFNLSVYYIKLGDISKAIENLKIAVGHAEKYDDRLDNIAYTTPWLNRLVDKKENTFKNYTNSCRQELLNKMGEPKFDVIRDNEEFIELQKRLNKN